jgi:hypothetical protein
MIRTVGLAIATTLGAIAIGSAAPAIATPLPQAPYKNCTEAKQNGDCDIPATSDKYQSKLDRDNDGLGCEC